MWILRAFGCGALQDDPISVPPINAIDDAVVLVTERPSLTGTLAVLPHEVLEHVVTFVGGSDSALSLGQTCRTWRRVVLQSHAWVPRLMAVSQTRAALLSKQLQQHREQDDFTSAIEWQRQLQRCLRDRYSRFSTETPPPRATPVAHFLSRARRTILREATRHCHLVVLGLPKAGTTSILRRLGGGSVVALRKSGVAVEQVEYRGCIVTCWDIAEVGDRPVADFEWEPHWLSAHGLLFVVDSTDRGGIFNSQAVLAQISTVPTLAREVPVCVLATKQDRLGAISPEAMSYGLQLRDSVNGRRWCVQGCSAVQGRGIEEAVEWMLDSLRSSRPDLAL